MLWCAALSSRSLAVRFMFCLGRGYVKESSGPWKMWPRQQPETRLCILLARRKRFTQLEPKNILMQLFVWHSMTYRLMASIMIPESTKSLFQCESCWWFACENHKIGECLAGQRIGLQRPELLHTECDRSQTCQKGACGVSAFLSCKRSRKAPTQGCSRNFCQHLTFSWSKHLHVFWWIWGL